MILFSDKNRFTRQTAKNISTKVRYLSIKKRNRGTNDFTDKALYPVLSPGQKEKAGLIGKRWSKKIGSGVLKITPAPNLIILLEKSTTTCALRR